MEEKWADLKKAVERDESMQIFLDLVHHPRWTEKAISAAIILTELNRFTVIRATDDHSIRTEWGTFAGKTTAHAAAKALLHYYEKGQR